MPEAPPLRLVPGVAVVRMGTKVQLRLGDERIHVLETDPPELALRVLACLDGSHDRASLLHALAEDAGVVAELVTELESRGWIARTEDPMRALDGARVTVRGHATAIAKTSELLVEHGFGLAIDGAAAEAPIVCIVEQPDLTLLFEANDAAITAGRSCLFVDLSHGTHATIGPFFVPGESACYRCFRTRLHENTAAYAELVSAEQQMLATRAPLPGPTPLPAWRAIVLGIATAELVAYVTRHRPLRTLDRILTVDLERLRIEAEPVLRVPWCDACAQESKA